ncbi:LOW QUALITY PROTEIN: uncharacterized protein C21orf58 [Alosa alosa]|uniref:LOW QUALITY PROTEIN: uncharacterized protein C21orf58 n=1 Tax=Alosa alosa TaxID=278164 RepID=UPI002015043D|nr:LOW QUALITY PROTEIN: uncharacterized protein C21orf58 [Alosa alosa]
MNDMVDQMTRLKLKLLEKRLENDRNNYDERGDSAISTRSYDGQADALHSALRRKRSLLQRLREQQLLEDLGRPHTWGGSHRHVAQIPFQQQTLLRFTYTSHLHLHLPLSTSCPHHLHPSCPRIIQQMLPQQPATIIQQLPQQQPLITQIPPPQLAPPYKSGSIKEDMVEMMLMQNAQMHQIIMQNMMLKALPPMALNSPMGAGHSAPSTPHSVVEMYPKAKGSAIHHHHHYSPSGPQLPPITYPIWGSQGGAHQPSVQHVMGPISLPPLNTGQRWN